MIKRDRYLNKIIEAMWDGHVKAIVGIKACGKTTILFEIFKDYLLKQGVQENNILTFELDKRKDYKFRNPITLCDYVENIVKTHQDEKFYLFIDEVQFTMTVTDDEAPEIKVTIYDMLNDLKSYKNLDVYVTGSNSKMLSTDIATEFRGRSTNIAVYPFSFKEYFEYVGGDWRDALDKYVIFGGMPAILKKKNDRQKMEYLSDLYTKVYLSDLIERNHIEHKEVLDSVLDYISSSISSLTNPTNIANALTTLRKAKIYSETISRYLDFCQDAFLIRKVNRYDIKGKNYFKSASKYYYTDIGLRNCRLNFRQIDYGHIMENIIFNELNSRGYNVDVEMILDRSEGMKKQLEVDFVVNFGDKRAYIQSSYQIDTTEKKNSETKSFKLIGDFFKRILIRNDIPRSFYDDDGIFNCTLFDFLMSDEDLF